MNPRTNLHHLDDMVAASERALRHAGGLSIDELASDELRSDAIVRALEVLGEACKRVSLSVKERFPEVPWKSMAGMRDQLIHKYDDVNWAIVHEVLIVHIPDVLHHLYSIRLILEAEEPRWE